MYLLYNYIYGYFYSYFFFFYMLYNNIRQQEAPG